MDAALDFTRIGLISEAALGFERRDPLSCFRFKSVGQELLCLFVREEIEAYWRAGNQSGKTFGGAALGVALARGLKELDGLPLPKVRTPSVGYVLTQTYKQQSTSTQAAYLELIGDWPHHIGYVDKANDYISTIWVKPDGCKSDDHRKWSKIVFHCAQTGRSIPGGRIDWAHADEPPKMSMWREVRARTRRNSPLYRWITATPLDRNEWEELERDFEGAYLVPLQRRVLLVTSVWDNEALSKAHIDKLMEDWRGDPYFDARTKGGLVDLSGKNPFTNNPDMAAQLGRWLKKTFPPKMVPVQILLERDTEDGRHVGNLLVEYEEYFPYEQGKEYLLELDPAQGINDPYHDPANIHVFLRERPGKRKLVARYNGFLGSYGLGFLGSVIGWRYNGAIMNIDMGGAYGDAALRGATQAGYSNFMLELIEERANKAAETFRIGYKPTGPKKWASIGDIQRAIMEDSIFIPSQAIITCLLNVTVDEIGRVAAVKGRHDEDMTNLGNGLIDLDRLGVTSMAKPVQPAFHDAVNAEMGRTVVPAIYRTIKRPTAGRAKPWSRR